MEQSPQPPADAPDDEPPLLPAGVPVVMPDLPLRLAVTEERQMAAIGDPTRSRILGVIQHQPATAKQIADRLRLAPGTVGHHLRVLEEAGLAQVVARRLVRGIVARYYTRTARIFDFHLPHEVEREISPSLEILDTARNELADALVVNESEDLSTAGFPHARLSPERARAYLEHMQRLLDDFVAEPVDPDGRVYGLCGAFFESPAYMQVAATSPDEPGPDEEDSDAPGTDAP
ncbi:MAG TPA: winged helix-turn-helix domain-containing protein [Thermomicrobiales bacterium]|nr:winged helix-turn-helix domain-containing protein [Thermomicrobiales bacterium]